MSSRGTNFNDLYKNDDFISKEERNKIESEVHKILNWRKSKVNKNNNVICECELDHRDGSVEVQYIIDEENRKVTCVMFKLSSPDGILDFALESDVEKITNLENPQLNNFGKVFLKLKKNKYVGVAVCDPRDKFDPIIGKAVAYKKARLQRHSDEIQTLYDLISNLDRTTEKIYNLIEIKKEKYQRLANRVSTLLDNNKEE